VLDDAYLPADVAMQRLEEHVPPPDDPEHKLTALAGSNFEREYAALRPSLLRVGGRVSVGGDPATVSRVLHTGHRYGLSIGRTQWVSLDVNGDDMDLSALDLTTRSAQAMPAYRDELLWALRRVVKGYCAWHGKPDDECAGHLKLLHGEWELADSVALAAQRLWTSLQKVDEHGVKSKTKGIEFCSLWSDVIRRDQASLARPPAIIARALNRQLVGAPSDDRDEVGGSADFPTAKHSRFPGLKFCTWRGGGFGVAGAADSSCVVGIAAGIFYAGEGVPREPVPGDVVQRGQGRILLAQVAPGRRGQGAGEVAGGAGPSRRDGSKVPLQARAVHGRDARAGRGGVSVQRILRLHCVGRPPAGVERLADGPRHAASHHHRAGAGQQVPTRRPGALAGRPAAGTVVLSSCGGLGCGAPSDDRDEVGGSADFPTAEHPRSARVRRRLTGG
jgi:hypothetical protein